MVIKLDCVKNISLTSVKKEDAKTIYDFYMEDKEELKNVFTFISDDLTLEDEEAFFEKHGEDHPFVIRVNNKICGYAVLYDYKELNKSISILYYVNSNFRGKGIATNAIKRLLQYAFEELDVNKVMFFINTDNYDSLNLVKRLGLREEGTLLDNDFVNGKYHDQKLYAILKREYPKLIKNSTKGSR